MTSWFLYEQATWPEIAALPRDLPLVVPLGDGFDLDQLATQLGEPPEAGLLPALPFGWQDSYLPVPDQLLTDLLIHLLTSLQEDGFTNAHVAAPPGVRLPLGDQLMNLPLSLGKEKGSTVPSEKDVGKVLLIPIGHTEQHGYHLPLHTDTVIIDAICRGVVAAVPDLAASLPVFPYGVSTHRAAFPGTFNVGGRVFEDFWLAVIEGLVGRGFNRFYLNSGHGGNCSFLVNVAKYAGERYRRTFCATSWLYLSGPEGIAALEQFRRSPIGGMGHAGELETSLMLHLAPAHVHMDRVRDDTDFVTTPSYYMDWVEGGALVANPTWEDDTISGAYGAGSLATAEHGKVWLRAAIAEKIDHVREIHTQHEQRELRRKSGYGRWGKPANFVPKKLDGNTSGT